MRRIGQAYKQLVDEQQTNHWYDAMRDGTDLLWYLALAMLPVDGTVLGPRMPYWSPISPWLFCTYALANLVTVPRTVADSLHRFAPFAAFPLVLAALSCYGWSTFGMRPVGVVTTFLALAGALACLLSLDIALRVKHLPWRPAVTVLVTAYAAVFAVGVLECLAIHLHVQMLGSYFSKLLLRPYIYGWNGDPTGRPQFLFAEPSYIGMHLFGVLLPVFWLTRDRRMAVLVPVFAVGAFAMGSGMRVLFDSVVALAIMAVLALDWHRMRDRVIACCGAVAVAVGFVVTMAVVPRARLIITSNPIAGDGSLAARIYHFLVLAYGWAHDAQHALLGFGAGNISAVTVGSQSGMLTLWRSWGGKINTEIEHMYEWSFNNFTMCAYASFITEFGLVGLGLLLVLIGWALARGRSEARRTDSARIGSVKLTICWLLLVMYLYSQFEGYAFYALPLFVWTIRNGMVQRAINPTNAVHL